MTIIVRGKWVITGGADAKDKFLAWARTVPHTLGRWGAWPQQLAGPAALGDLPPPQRSGHALPSGRVCS